MQSNISGQAGRPQLELDTDELVELMRFYPTLAETACWLNCSEDTIERRVREVWDITFAEFRLRFSGKTRLLLKRKAISMALESNDSKMLTYCLRALSDLDDRPSDRSPSEICTIRLSYSESNL